MSKHAICRLHGRLDDKGMSWQSQDQTQEAKRAYQRADDYARCHKNASAENRCLEREKTKILQEHRGREWPSHDPLKSIYRESLCFAHGFIRADDGLWLLENGDGGARGRFPSFLSTQAFQWGFCDCGGPRNRSGFYRTVSLFRSDLAYLEKLDGNGRQPLFEPNF